MEEMKVSGEEMTSMQSTGKCNRQTTPVHIELNLKLKVITNIYNLYNRAMWELLKLSVKLILDS